MLARNMFSIAVFLHIIPTSMIFFTAFVRLSGRGGPGLVINCHIKPGCIGSTETVVAERLCFPSASAYTNQK